MKFLIDVDSINQLKESGKTKHIKRHLKMLKQIEENICDTKVLHNNTFSPYIFCRDISAWGTGKYDSADGFRILLCNMSIGWS